MPIEIICEDGLLQATQGMQGLNLLATRQKLASFESRQAWEFARCGSGVERLPKAAKRKMSFESGLADSQELFWAKMVDLEIQAEGNACYFRVDFIVDSIIAHERWRVSSQGALVKYEMGWAGSWNMHLREYFYTEPCVVVDNLVRMWHSVPDTGYGFGWSIRLAGEELALRQQPYSEVLFPETRQVPRDKIPDKIQGLMKRIYKWTDILRKVETEEK